MISLSKVYREILKNCIDYISVIKERNLIKVSKDSFSFGQRNVISYWKGHKTKRKF